MCSYNIGEARGHGRSIGGVIAWMRGLMLQKHLAWPSTCLQSFCLTSGKFSLDIVLVTYLFSPLRVIFVPSSSPK